MSKDLEFETYLSISPRKLGIYLFDIKNQKNLYKEELIINENDLLKNFLDDNIFKIEKLIGNFIENINLIIENENVFNLQIGIKKKNYKKNIEKKILEIALTEVKDLLKENYQEYNIMHIVVNNYIINGKNYSKFINDLDCDSLCLDVSFILISNNLVSKVDKVLENYQIKTKRYLSKRYIKNFFKEKDLELSKIAYRIQNGHNENEVTLTQKNTKNQGFFEKFFQLFS